MKPKVSMYSRFGKRFFDLMLAILVFVLISPALGVIALLIRFKMGGPVFFRQIRPRPDLDRVIDIILSCRQS